MNNKSPMVSIVVPVYNVEKYVETCIESVLTQTLKDFEIVIIDDVSTDQSYEIIRRNYSKYHNVKFVQNETNLGLGATRNIGINLAHGKYIYFVDSDDVILPNCIEKLYGIAEANEADIVHMAGFYTPVEEDFSVHEGIKVNVSKCIDCHPNVYRTPSDLNKRLREHYIRYGVAPMTWLNFYRREFLLKNSTFFPDMAHEDEPFAIAGYLFTDRIWIVPEFFYVYRQRTTSLMHDISYRRLKNEVQAMVIGIRYINDLFHRVPGQIDDRIKCDVLNTFFCRVWNNILNFYSSDKKTDDSIRNTVDEALSEFFPRDSFFIGTMLHYASINQKKSK